MATGGSIESVSIGGRSFPVAADNDANRDLGGFTNEVMPNGDGTARTIKNRKPWMLDGLELVIDDLRDDQEYLQDVADLDGYETVAVTYASGAVYQGEGTVTGDLKFKNQSATAGVNLTGPQKMTRQ